MFAIFSGKHDVKLTFERRPRRFRVRSRFLEDDP